MTTEISGQVTQRDHMGVSTPLICKDTSMSATHLVLYFNSNSHIDQVKFQQIKETISTINTLRPWWNGQYFVDGISWQIMHKIIQTFLSSLSSIFLF